MMELSTPRRLLLATISGLLCFLSFPPLGWHWLAWFALWPLLIAVIGARSWVALFCGMAATFSFYGLSVYWVFNIMYVFGRLNAGAAAGVLLLLLLYLSIYRIAFCLLVAWLGRRSIGLACLAAPFLWVVMEMSFVRTPHFSLPWNLLGYAATQEMGILQLASVTGVYGLSFLMAAYAALLTHLPQDRTLTPSRFPTVQVLVGMTAAILASQVSAPFLVPKPAAQHRARLVQANFQMNEPCSDCTPEKLAADLDEIERLSLTAAPEKPLLVWPEVPRPFYMQDAQFAARAQRVASANAGNFLLGVIEWHPDGGVSAGGDSPKLRPRNSAVFLGPAGERLYTYDKIHLVPFGEYVPLREWFSFAGSLVAEVGGFAPGSERALAETGGGKLATLICFEAVFPHEVREFVARGAGLLVNISNDGWLGDTGGPAQHMEMARMRAVENRRWLLRATNNGRTAVIDPYGRITATLPPGQRAALDADFDYRNDLTLYARYGDWFAWGCLGVSLALAGSGLSRQERMDWKRS